MNGIDFLVFGFGFNYIASVTSFQDMTGIDGTKGKQTMEIWVVSAQPKRVCGRM